ncbi:MAG: hypothetical protein OXI91_08330 [Chloroflexota bacterium]|nr:hypothetical protein [Chloroflexota bacterium]
MGAKPGDYLEISEAPGGFLVRPRRIDEARLAALKDRVPPDHPVFDAGAFREGTYDPALRD